MAEKDVGQCVHVKQKVDELASVCPRRAQKDGSPRSPGLGSDGELHESDIRQVAEAAIQTPPLRTTPAQCRRDDEQNRVPQILRGPTSTDGHQTHQYALLPNGSGAS